MNVGVKAISKAQQMERHRTLRAAFYSGQAFDLKAELMWVKDRLPQPYSDWKVFVTDLMQAIELHESGTL